MLIPYLALGDTVAGQGDWRGVFEQQKPMWAQGRTNVEADVLGRSLGKRWLRNRRTGKTFSFASF